MVGINPKIVTLARSASEEIRLAMLTRIEVASRFPSLAQRASVQSVREIAPFKTCVSGDEESDDRG